LAQAAIDEGVDPFLATMEGLAEGMILVGDLYNKKEYFVSELLLCADALYAGLELLKPAIVASGRISEAKGSIVLGVVEGDVHDIGKNLIKMMFDVAGWTVYDLGKDVPLEKFVEEQLRTDSDIVGLSHGFGHSRSLGLDDHQHDQYAGNRSKIERAKSQGPGDARRRSHNP